MAELPEGFVLEGDALPAGFQLEEPPKSAGDLLRSAIGQTAQRAYDFTTLPSRALGTITGGSVTGGVGGSLPYGAQGVMRGLTGVLDIPGQLMNLATGREDQTLGQTVRQAIGSAQERVGALTGRSAPGTRYQYETIEDIPPEYRASARFGEAVGATYPMAAAPLVAARAMSMPAALAAQTAAPTATGLGPAASNAVRQMVATAAANPAFSVASQIPSTLGAGVGAYGAEMVFPGSERAQMVGQFSGGLLGAGLTAGAMGAGGAARGRVSAALPGTEAAAREQAGRALAPILEQAGETPAQIIQRLQRPDIVPGALPAELAQSRGITGVQRYLAGQDTELANALAASRERVAAGIQAGVEEAFQPGSTQALTQAAQTRQRGFMQRLDNLATQAEQKAIRLGEQAATAAEPIAPLAPGQARGVNVQARNILEDALMLARKEESKLWNAIPDNLRGQPSSTLRAYDDIRANILPEEKLPSLVENVMTRYRTSIDEGKPIDFGDLKRLRTKLLTSAREARASNAFDDARIYNQVADGVLEDMSRLGGSAAAAARDYSRALNDRFSRSFAGDVLGTKPSGAERIRPELTLEAATAGSPELTAARLGEMQTAAGGLSPIMQLTQRDFMRSFGANVFDPTTGAINPAKADTFLRNNAAVMEMFPDYANMLRQASQAQRAAGEATKAVPQIERATAAAAKEAERVSAFGRVLAAGENPADAVASALRAPNPMREMNRLSTLALRGGPDAVGGLRGAVLKNAMDDATTSNGISYGKLSASLLDPVSERGMSVLGIMERNKIMTADQRGQIEAFIKRGIERDAADVMGVDVKQFGSVAGMTRRYIPRIIGAKLSSLFSGGGAGESLQIAQMGANAAENIAVRLPADKVSAVMSQALKADTPQELIEILERAATYSPRGQIAMDPATRELIGALRAMMVAPGYESERPPGGASAFRPEQLGRR